MNDNTVTVKGKDGSTWEFQIPPFDILKYRHGMRLEFTNGDGEPVETVTVWWPWSRRWKLYAQRAWRWLWWPYHFVGRAFHVVNDWLDPYDD